MSPEWSDFRILVALASAGSVAGAARELGVDGSTVSRRLSALEECMGARLIVRGGREFAWTAEGRSALTAAEGMKALVENATRSCRESKLEASGSVRISLPPAFLPLLMMNFVQQVKEKHPLLKLDMSADFRKVDLVKGEADMAVRMIRPSEPDMIARHALDAGWCVYASATYLGTRGSPAKLEDLAQHHLLLYDESMHFIPPLRWMEAYKGTDFVRVDNLELVSQLVVAGSGIGVLPAFYEPISPQLIRVFPEPVAFNTGYIVYHESVRDTARIRAAADALVEFLQANASIFTGRPG